MNDDDADADADVDDDEEVVDADNNACTECDYIKSFVGFASRFAFVSLARHIPWIECKHQSLNCMAIIWRGVYERWPPCVRLFLHFWFASLSSTRSVLVFPREGIMEQSNCEEKKRLSPSHQSHLIKTVIKYHVSISPPRPTFLAQPLNQRRRTIEREIFKSENQWGRTNIQITKHFFLLNPIFLPFRNWQEEEHKSKRKLPSHSKTASSFILIPFPLLLTVNAVNKVKDRRLGMTIFVQRKWTTLLRWDCGKWR